MHICKDIVHSKSLKAAWNYLIGPPGWSPDGSRLTVEQMRQQNKSKTE